jgi:hypothetical protein
MSTRPLGERIVAPFAVGVTSITCQFVVIWSCVSAILAPLLQNGTVLHTIKNPSGQIAAVVISDGCGITCGCTIRVDLQTPKQYYKEVLRRVDVCDADIVWMSDTTFEISSYDQGYERFDIGSLGIDQ